jgi:hypothetical protein
MKGSCPAVSGLFLISPAWGGRRGSVSLGCPYFLPGNWIRIYQYFAGISERLNCKNYNTYWIIMNYILKTTPAPSLKKGGEFQLTVKFRLKKLLLFIKKIKG